VPGGKKPRLALSPTRGKAGKTGDRKTHPLLSSAGEKKSSQTASLKAHSYFNKENGSYYKVYQLTQLGCPGFKEDLPADGAEYILSLKTASVRFFLKLDVGPGAKFDAPSLQAGCLPLKRWFPHIHRTSAPASGQASMPVNTCRQRPT